MTTPLSRFKKHLWWVFRTKPLSDGSKQLLPNNGGLLDIVHRDPQLALEFAAVMHPDDMRVKQRRRQVGFAVKPLTEVVVRCHPAPRGL